MRTALLVLSLLLLTVGCSGDDEPTATSASGECESVEAPDARQAEVLDAPPGRFPKGNYALVFETTCGTFTVELDMKLAPNTASSLIVLARGGYFDDTIFHRVVPGFVIQGGDPTQRGSGGPGYSTVDVPPPDAAYTKGVVAMAKLSVEAPGTSGSQFFVVTAEDAGLPPEYAIVGEVTDGMDTVERIDALGVGDGPPSQPVVVSSVTVTES